MMNHEYLIDGEGRRWCADDCPTESPHWTGEFETMYEIGGWRDIGDGMEEYVCRVNRLTEMFLHTSPGETK